MKKKYKKMKQIKQFIRLVLCNQFFNNHLIFFSHVKYHHQHL